MRCSLALAMMTIGLVSCGGQNEPADTRQRPLEASAGKPAATAGEIGEATLAAPNAGTRRLSRGGRPNPAPPPRPAGGAAVGAEAGCGDVDLDPDAANLAAVAEMTLCLVNAERTARGLGALRRNAELDRAATAHADDMVRRGYFAHMSPEGGNMTTRVKATAYLTGTEEWTLGENLAWGTGVLARPGAIVNAWMNSPGHRANVLRAVFDEIGLGLVLGSPNLPEGATFVHVFGSATGSSPVAEAGTAGEESAPSAAPSARPATSSRRARARARRRCARLATARARKRCRAQLARRGR